MEEIIELRRKRSKNGQFISNDKIGMRFSLKEGRFVIFSNLTKMLDLNNGEAIMFSVSKKDNCLFVFKEDNCYDNYIVKKANGNYSYSRFTAKYLAKDIVDYLDLNKKQVLNVDIKTNKNDFYSKVNTS